MPKMQWDWFYLWPNDGQWKKSNGYSMLMWEGER